jgi:hypothetical protein
MSQLTTTPTSAHRAQIVAEAVVSAYINEITPTPQPHERVRVRLGGPRRSVATGRAAGRGLPRRRLAPGAVAV